MTKPDISKAYEVQRNMLRKTGLWPQEDPPFLYNLKCVISWILALMLCVTMWMEIINDLNDFGKVSEILYVAISGTIYIVKLFCLTYYKKTFVDMEKLLKLPIFTSYPDDIDHYMANTIKIVVFLANVYRYLCLCCMLLYSIYPFLDNKPLPFPFPYDLGKYTYLMYIFQIISVYCAAWNTSTTDTLQVSFLAIASAQLDILAAKVIHLLDYNIDAYKCGPTEGEKIEIINTLRQCVQHHLAIIQYIEGIETIFSLAIFAQFIGSTFVICNTLFYFLLISEASSMFLILINYLIVMLVELFMFCWAGNEIIVKSLKIADACYMSKWYIHDNNARKYLFIIMERSRGPLTVTVFSISNLSVESFKSILQWSYSCFALLLNLYYTES